tara:strand:- start:11068 stop:11205 length:138 start_codon:yes stop_codon:yes gene_type:complete
VAALKHKMAVRTAYATLCLEALEESNERGTLLKYKIVCFLIPHRN